jgi:hypothetical protein
MICKYTWRAAACALTAVAWLGGFSTSAQALDLLGDYQKALAYDPTFQTALAERQANLASATQARVAYLPEGSISNQRLQTDTSDRRTLTLTQPLLSLERIATFRMAEPREAFAEATSQAENLLGLAMQTATEPEVAVTTIMRFIAAE